MVHGQLELVSENHDAVVAKDDAPHDPPPALHIMAV